jgi:hypothetical protein
MGSQTSKLNDEMFAYHLPACFSPSTPQSIIDCFTAHGGLVIEHSSEDLPESTTAIFFSKEMDKHVKQLQEFGAIIYDADWVKASIEAGRPLDLTHWILDSVTKGGKSISPIH